VLIFVLAMAGAALSAWAAKRPRAARAVVPGTVVRWNAPGATACVVAGRVWASHGETCFFPIDLLAKGTVRLERMRGEHRDVVTVKVGAYPYPEQRLTVDDRLVHLSPADEARAAREAERVTPLWQRESPPRFDLPLRPPLAELPAGGHFGARRVLNNEPRSPHTGVDYSVPAGTPVLAVADGVVVLAEEHFFSGQSVYIDHGGGLVSCYFHLSRTAVKPGAEVRAGEEVGRVGATGRATGPHLHFAVRWHGARINPAVLLGPPAALRSLDGSSTSGVE